MMRKLALPLVLTLVALTGCSGQPGLDVSFSPDIHAGDWLNGQVVYEMHLRAFSSEGTLTAARQSLNRLAPLAYPHLILAPINPTGNQDRTGSLGNLYAVRDHRAVDPRYGDLAEVKKLVAAAHRNGSRVLLDVVLPAAAVDHVALAEHPTWLLRNGDGKLAPRLAQWKGVAEFDLSQPEVRNYLKDSLVYWVKETGVDGFRCALATFAPDEFWVEMIHELRSSFPHLAFIAEAIDTRYLELGFDAVYGPGLKSAMDECRQDDMAQPGYKEDIWITTEQFMADTAKGGTFLTFLEDHFHARCAKLYSPDFLRGYAALLMTLPGTPQLLMGQEVGSLVQADPQEPWQIDWEGGDPEYLRIYGEVCRLRAASPALQKGSARRLPVKHSDLLVHVRELPNETVLCAANLSNSKPRFHLPREFQGRNWHRWDGTGFATQTLELEDEVIIDPGSYGVWRLAD